MVSLLKMVFMYCYWNTNEYAIIVLYKGKYQMVKIGKYFADFNFHHLPRNTTKIGRHENFSFYGIMVEWVGITYKN